MNLTDLTYEQFLDANEKKRIEQQLKQYKYFAGDKDAIQSYLQEALSLNYSDVDEMRLSYINFVAKVVNQKSVIYNKSATRTLLVNGKPDTEVSKYYNSLLPKSINLSNKTAVKMAVLSNTSLTRVMFDKTNKKVKYRVEPSYLYHVETSDSDQYDIELLAYPTRKALPNKTEQVWITVWTKDYHYYVTPNGDKVPVGDNYDMVNPYKDANGNGIIPFAVLRIDDGEDFWGEGANDLVEANEDINMILTDFMNNGLLFGSATTPLLVNCKTDERTVLDGKARRTISFGMKHPVYAEDVRVNEFVKPSIEFVKPDVPITEISEVVEKKMKLYAINAGLNPNSMTLDSNSTSGASKMMDALDEIHIREAMIEQVRNYEDELFNITKIVINTHASEVGIKPIDWESEIKVNFSEVQIPVGMQDKWLDREMQFKYNIATPKDWIIAEDKDLSTIEAEERIKNNTATNSTYQINELKQATNVPQKNENQI